jgi:hypothetical protein
MFIAGFLSFFLNADENNEGILIKYPSSAAGIGLSRYY